MRYGVNLDLFAKTAHSPTLASLTRSMGKPATVLKDFCIPVNPYFPTREMMKGYAERLERILKYYPDQNTPLCEALSAVVTVPANNLVVANGSTELITWLDHLMVAESLAIPVPTFGRWTDQPKETGKRVEYFARLSENNFHLDVDEFADFCLDKKVNAAVLCNPNNPTGVLLERVEVVHLMDRLRDLDLIVIDESFIEFVNDSDTSVEHEATLRNNVVVVKSLGKNFGLHGVRMGYGVANEGLASRLRHRLPHWNLNSMAETIIRELPNHWGDYRESLSRIAADREYLIQRLEEVREVTLFPSRANFIYIHLDELIDGTDFRNHLLGEHGILVRQCGNKIGADNQYFRVSVHPRKTTDELITGIQDTMTQLRSRR